MCGWIRSVSVSVSLYRNVVLAFKQEYILLTVLGKTLLKPSTLSTHLVVIDLLILNSLELTEVEHLLG